MRFTVESDTFLFHKRPPFVVIDKTNRRLKMIVRTERCVDCGDTFTIDIKEFIHKLENGMKLPKRCLCCRKKNRINPNPYAGMYQVMKAYPTTKGHHKQVHGGATNF